MEQLHLDWISHILQVQKRTIEGYNRCITAAARRAGLTKPEADVLLFLANNPACRTARDVVACRGFSKTYVSRAVEQLAARGYVAVETSAADRRLQYLRLTESVAQPVGLLRRAQTAYFQKLLSGVSDGEITRLLRLFEQIQTNLDRMQFSD